MITIASIFGPLAILGMVPVIFAQFRLKHHIDRNALLEMEDLSKLFDGSGPPKSILTPRGKKIHKALVIGFSVSIASLAIIAIANFPTSHAAKSLFTQKREIDCPDTAITICQKFLMKGNSNKCDIKSLEYLLTPNKGLSVSRFRKYYGNLGSCDSLDGKAICQFDIADNVRLVAESQGDSIYDSRILKTMLPHAPGDSSRIDSSADLSDSTYKYVLTGLLAKHGIEGVNNSNADRIIPEKSQ